LVVTGVEAGDEDHQLEIGAASRNPGLRPLHGGSLRRCRRQGRARRRLSEAKLSGEARVLQDLSWALGSGLLWVFPHARLAGQQPKYLENQLRAFIERRRTNPVMFNVAHSLSPSIVEALAAHFRDLNPRPIGGGPRDRVATGRTIYQEGLPESNVPACSACHGPDAKGQDEIPRLAGQLFPYTVKELTNWSKERGQGSGNDTSAIMVPTAHNLTQSQIAAIAAYLSYLD
jgi:cytochrome c553